MYLNSLNVIQIFEARAQFGGVVINKVKYEALSKYWSRASDCLIEGLEAMIEVVLHHLAPQSLFCLGAGALFQTQTLKMQSSVVLTGVFKDML